MFSARGELLVASNSIVVLVANSFARFTPSVGLIKVQDWILTFWKPVSSLEFCVF
jgi:hypothetical protein